MSWAPVINSTHTWFSRFSSSFVWVVDNDCMYCLTFRLTGSGTWLALAILLPDCQTAKNLVGGRPSLWKPTACGWETFYIVETVVLIDDIFLPFIFTVFVYYQAWNQSGHLSTFCRLDDSLCWCEYKHLWLFSLYSMRDLDHLITLQLT